ncbi:MAG TPA: hypothetical protein VMI33_07150 [Streptosporangiaceae bacterium]|nr:hypothetical protein [Streptosporangiaceae bacterium]
MPRVAVTGGSGKLGRFAVAEVFPDVRVARELGPHETLLSCAKASHVLGYQPAHSWRDEAGEQARGARHRPREEMRGR